MYLAGHEIDHANNHENEWYSATNKQLEKSAVSFGNYLRSVYGEKNMRTSYSGLGLRFSDNPKSYNSRNEKVTGFKKTNDFSIEGNTISAFSYETSENGTESEVKYMLGLTTKDGKFHYRIFKDKKEYDSHMEYLKNRQKKENEENED